METKDGAPANVIVQQDAGAVDNKSQGPDTIQNIVKTVDNNKDIEANITHDGDIQ